MKTTAFLKGIDVGIRIILLTVLITLGTIVLEIGHIRGPADKQKPNVTPNPGFRNSSIKTRCYSLPYSREQLKKMEKDKEAREELKQMLIEKTLNEDISQIVAPPKVIFDEKSSMVCLDFNDPAMESDPFETRIV